MIDFIAVLVWVMITYVIAAIVYLNRSGPADKTMDLDKLHRINMPYLENQPVDVETMKKIIVAYHDSMCPSGSDCREDPMTYPRPTEKFVKEYLRKLGR